MYREAGHREEKRAGKRFLISILCLILLSGISVCLAYTIKARPDENAYFMARDGETVFSKAAFLARRRGTYQGYEDELKELSGFDNPIDGRFLPMLKGGGESRIETLKSYEEAWRRQLLRCLADYGAKCRYERDREMAEGYLAAVSRAVDAQKNLMEYLGVEEEKQLWYSVQIYRCAYLKDIRGGFALNEPEAVNTGLGESGSGEISALLCEEYGEFTNEIDKEFITTLYEGSEIEFRGRQEKFDIDWCNELCGLTLEFYEGLDEEGKRLAGLWQESRENWKGASDGRFWWEPEELNREAEDALFWGNGTRAGLMEKDGWINRLYYLQLRSMMA